MSAREDQQNSARVAASQREGGDHAPERERKGAPLDFNHGLPPAVSKILIPLHEQNVKPNKALLWTACINSRNKLQISISTIFAIAGSLAKEPEDSSDNSSNPRKRLLSPKSELKPLDSMPQFDVVTPIPTIPASNPVNPTAGRTPSYDPYTTPTMETPSSSSSGSSWCIAAPSAAQASLQAALDYACGHGGTDCSQIKPGGSCFVPDTVRDHASYAFNIYYEKTPIPGSCDFGGNAIITNIDPSKY
ncbi:Glucan endo-1,3-beta-glucosidase 1 [Platanthera guangdongensis]|uniref:Glucan endo-1,3-beta-glucosidase 1 n=1 Tax=Platanthera guangdongensis TaxID=2320717 RepID=A0ABR2LKE0_9ASPA